MNYVLFGDYHSYNDFSLFLIGKTIAPAEAKEEYLDVPGFDGELDLTEYFGEVKYKKRTLTFEFQTKLRHEKYYQLYETISNAIHGKSLNVHLSEDEYFHFEGRVKLNEYKSNEKIGTIVIEVYADPYKVENFDTINDFVLTGQEREVCIVNLKKSVTPSVKVVANEGEDITLKFGEFTYMLSSGTYTLPELVLREGNNNLILNGVGKIAFIYRRGKL